jgi:oxygen-independent coproporphyrinogen-3 oxidase
VVSLAQSIGNVSLDLIFAAPGETLPVWEEDLEVAISLPIRHLSTYALTIEKGSSFYGQYQRGTLTVADDELHLAMYETAIDRLEKAGWVHYEVSSFARPGFECRHNHAYWEGRGWWGVGAGAARFVNGLREVNHRSTTQYIKRLLGGESPIAEQDAITPRQWALERIAFGLRRRNGISLNAILAEAGISSQSPRSQDATFNDLDQLFSEWEVQALVERHEPARWRLTHRGLLVSDSIIAKLLQKSGN